jgi:hypothetical protein
VVDDSGRPVRNCRSIRVPSDDGIERPEPLGFSGKKYAASPGVTDDLQMVCAAGCSVLVAMMACTSTFMLLPLLGFAGWLTQELALPVNLPLAKTD